MSVPSQLPPPVPSIKPETPEEGEEMPFLQLPPRVSQIAQEQIAQAESAQKRIRLN